MKFSYRVFKYCKRVPSMTSIEILLGVSIDGDSNTHCITPAFSQELNTEGCYLEKFCLVHT